MAHPYKAAAHRHDPKWLSGLRTGYADGGIVPPPLTMGGNFDGMPKPDALKIGGMDANAPAAAMSTKGLNADQFRRGGAVKKRKGK